MLVNSIRRCVYSGLGRRLGLVRAYSMEVEIPTIHPLLLKRAEAMKDQYKDLETKISDGNYDQSISKQFSTISTILQYYNQYQKDLEEIKGLVSMDDPELLEEVQEELNSIVPQFFKSSHFLQSRLLPPILHADRPCIMELRPGVGGSEAALFTKDLANMYINFANHMRWKHTIISEQVNNNGFVSEIILSIDEPGAYNQLRHESGIHRVQRIPSTESKGRIHTSTSAIVVLPKMSDGNENSLMEDERQFSPGEVRVDTMRAGGKGGQHVNTTDSAVRLVHIPTGIMVMQQDERSQPRNKAKAFSILRARLAALDREKELAEQRKLRTDQVSSTDRSDKIRTYNYPQNRVTDHRCNYSVHDVDGCMQGTKLMELIEKVEEYEFEDRLQLLIDSGST